MTDRAPTVSENGVALYYPFIHVRDPAWLKVALLFWDKVARIVPGGFDCKAEDDPEVTTAAEADVLDPIDPSPYLIGAARRFKDTIVPLFENNDRTNPVIAALHDIATDPGPQFAHIHPSKIDAELRDWVLRQRIARIEEVQDRAGRLDPELRMHPAAALAYMKCLASEIGSQVGMPMVTDRSKVLECGEYLVFGPPEQRAEKAPILRVHVPFPDAWQLRDVPIDKVLRFREQHGDKPRLLRKALEQIAEEASNIKDPNKLRQYLGGKQKQIDKLIKDQTKLASTLNISTFASVLQLSVPALVAGGMKYAGATDAVTAIVSFASLAIVSFGVWAKHQLEKRKLPEQPFQYLLAVNRRYR